MNGLEQGVCICRLWRVLIAVKHEYNFLTDAKERDPRWGRLGRSGDRGMGVLRYNWWGGMNDEAMYMFIVQNVLNRLK